MKKNNEKEVVKEKRKKGLFEGRKYKALIFKGKVYEVSFRAQNKKVFYDMVSGIKDNTAILSLPGVDVKETEFIQVMRARGK